jgi:hypothetical protein
LIHKQKIEKLENQTKTISDKLAKSLSLERAANQQFKQLSLKRELRSGEIIQYYYVPIVRRMLPNGPEKAIFDSSSVY